MLWLVYYYNIIFIDVSSYIYRHFIIENLNFLNANQTIVQQQVVSLFMDIS